MLHLSMKQLKLFDDSDFLNHCFAVGGQCEHLETTQNFMAIFQIVLEILPSSEHQL